MSEQLIKAAPLISAVIAGISAVFSAIALGVAAHQMVQTRKTAVLQSLQEFFMTIIERERALSAASTGTPEHTWAFEEFLNCLELYSSVLNHRMLKDPAREIVRDKIIDSVVIIQEYTNKTLITLEEHITSEAAYIHLRKFIQLNRQLIDSRRSVRQRAFAQHPHEAI
jgi:hypothetical protein